VTSRSKAAARALSLAGSTSYYTLTSFATNTSDGTVEPYKCLFYMENMVDALGLEPRTR
jgi:hypothetical protein